MGISSDEGPGGATPEYERQRRVRIQENRAKLDALGLPAARQSCMIAGSSSSSKIASSFGSSNADLLSDTDPTWDEPIAHRKGYQAFVTSLDKSSFEGFKKCLELHISGGLSLILCLLCCNDLTKEKQKGSSKLSKLTNKTKTRGLDELLDDDFTLKQAIDLSIGERLVDSSETLSGFPQNSETIVASSSLHKKDSITNYRPSGRQKNKIVKSRIQLTEDEMVAYFFTLDEVGKGYLTLRDLHRLALAHDFSWTEDELFSMIQCFDSDGDGKLSLEDFRTIVCRCNILQDEGRP
ncbi:hypothetical protein ZIOFF_033347 [Zingiber officinale]|uniref:EF-hand domain-containing protein n=1 Tax=Zingiber officinale TaxID=94328 RepID=A0A8J5GJQ6_ZINOF|nr:hypothetical protein ZIOFF_033347 [Zingiber officinale]